MSITWRTAVSRQKDGELWIRGVPLADLIQSATFTESVFLILQGKKPRAREREMLDAILTACIEHGAAVPSAFVPRVVASTGNPMNAALAAGVLSLGDAHGGAIEGVMKMLSSGAIPGDRIPGLGHKLYKETDPRAELLFTKAKKLKVGGMHVELMRKIQKDFARDTGKRLPINVDGACGAILCDMGFDWRLGKAIFILGRLPGMIAHAHEEMVHEKPFRRFDESDVEYIGA